MKIKFNKTKIAYYTLKFMRVIGYGAVGSYIAIAIEYGLDTLIAVGGCLGLALGIISSFTLDNAFTKQ